jgi:hypothetical protein
VTLPANWESLSLHALYERLNEPGATAEVTIDAIMFSLRARGVAALKEPATKARWDRCDESAKDEIRKRWKAFRAHRK